MTSSTITKFKNGDSIKGFYICKNIQNKVTRLGDEYLDLILQDSSGTIRAKIWSYVNNFKVDLNNGVHVAVKGKVITYNDELEIDVLYINSIENNLYDKYGYKEDSLMRFSYKELGRLFGSLKSNCELLPESYKKNVFKLIDDYKDEIIKIPSLSRKYNFSGGFLKQLTCVISLNKKIYKMYSYNYVQTLAGIICKNIGLLNYFNINDNFLVSDENEKIGYKILGINLIDKYFKADQDITIFIKNTIISNNNVKNYTINVINDLYDFDEKLIK